MACKTESGASQSHFTHGGSRVTLMGMRSQPGATETAQQGEPGAWKRLTGSLPDPPRTDDRDDPLWQQLTAHFGWYDKAATRNRLAYLVIKMTALASGAAVTVLAALSAPAALTASVAGVIVVMEGAQQLFQLHPNWLSYRGTAELLRQQAFLYVADVSPYDDPATRRDRLAAFLRALTAKENANWANTMKQGDSSLRGH